MTFIRSVLFNIFFYVNMIIMMIIFTPYCFFCSRQKAWVIVKLWARINHWLLKTIVGCRFEIEGLEHIKHEACIIAPKHQAFWDVYAFLPIIPDGIFILKRELMRIPVFGWYLRKMEMIPIDRGSRSVALKSIVSGALPAIESNRQIVIYPEGTRRTPGDIPNYKYGVAHLYKELNLPVIPIAHVAGLYWPKHTFWRYQGVIKCRILPAILPGLSTTDFLKRLQEVTEKACDELLIEASLSTSPPRLPKASIERLETLKSIR
jgi:1-acyl-sn-glycerol-3-phosphate acyltransferase